MSETRHEGMIKIPAGPSILGTSREDAEALADQFGFHPSWLEDEVPRREIFLDTFWIDAFEVTNQEFLEFVIATDRPWPLRPDNDAFLLQESRLPATRVNWKDADAYASWRGKRLPTGLEIHHGIHLHQSRIDARISRLRSAAHLPQAEREVFQPVRNSAQEQSPPAYPTFLRTRRASRMRHTICGPFSSDAGGAL